MAISRVSQITSVIRARLRNRFLSYIQRLIVVTNEPFTRQRAIVSSLIQTLGCVRYHLAKLCTLALLERIRVGRPSPRNISGEQPEVRYCPKSRGELMYGSGALSRPLNEGHCPVSA